MVELTHTIKDTLGFHARSVMLVSNECARWKSDMVGDTISVKISGPDEQDAADFVAHLLRRL